VAVFRVQAVKVAAHFGPALESPARGQRHQLDTAVLPVADQFVEQVAQRVGAHLAFKQRAHLAQGQGRLRADERGLEDTFGLSCIHGLESGCHRADRGSGFRRKSGPYRAALLIQGGRTVRQGRDGASLEQARHVTPTAL
jgi:hypothetical protein